MQAGANVQAEVQSVIDEVNRALKAKQLKPLQGQKLGILRCCLSHQQSLTYAEIAHEIGGKPNALKQAGSALRKILESVTDRAIDNKDQFGSIVWAWYRNLTQERNTKIIGRHQELRDISEAITRDGCLLCIYGPPLIGKTKLASVIRQRFRFTNNTDSPFESVLDLGVQEHHTIADLCFYIQSQLPTDVVNRDLRRLTDLTDVLRQHRLLLTIDRTHTLYDPEDSDGRFNQDEVGKNYEKWLQLLTQTYDLQSCVIWIAPRRPHCLLVPADHVYLQQLQALKLDDALKFLLGQKLPPVSIEKLSELAVFCGRNPGVLKLAELKIYEEYQNDIDAFMDMPLRDNYLYPQEEMWLSALKTLTVSEQKLLGWLLLQPDPSIKKHFDDGVYPSQQWWGALNALQHRGFIERHTAGHYEIQSPWLRHVVARFVIERLANAIWHSIPEAIDILEQYPLVSPRASAWKRHWCRRYVLLKVSAALSQASNVSDAWSQTERRKRFEAFLSSIQENKNTHEPWLVGNLLTMAAALEIPLNGVTISNAAIHYADLREHRFQRVTFQDCQFTDTALPIKVHGRLATTLSPDGSALAIGDTQGRVLCWRLHDDAVQLKHFTRIADKPGISKGITHLAFGDKHTLAIAANQKIYHWFASEGSFSSEELELPIDNVPKPISCLSAQEDSHIAVGLITGEIIFWHDFEGITEKDAHRKAVKTLVFTSGSSRLLSIGYGDRILDWDISSKPMSKEKSSGDDLLITAAFQGGQLVFAYSNNDDSSWGIRLQNGERQKFPFKVDGDLIRFSRNGKYFAVLVNSDVRVFAASDLSSHHTIPVEHAPTHLMISNDGAWLLTTVPRNNTTKVQLWNVTSCKLWWEIQSIKDRDDVALETDQKLIFQRCQIQDSAAEQSYFTDYYGSDFTG